MVVVEALPLLPLKEIDVFSADDKVGAFVAACDLRKSASLLPEIAARSSKVHHKRPRHSLSCHAIPHSSPSQPTLLPPLPARSLNHHWPNTNRLPIYPPGPWRAADFELGRRRFSSRHIFAACLDARRNLVVDAELVTPRTSPPPHMA